MFMFVCSYLYSYVYSYIKHMYRYLVIIPCSIIRNHSHGEAWGTMPGGLGNWGLVWEVLHTSQWWCLECGWICLGYAYIDMYIHIYIYINIYTCIHVIYVEYPNSISPCIHLFCEAKNQGFNRSTWCNHEDPEFSELIHWNRAVFSCRPWPWHALTMIFSLLPELWHQHSAKSVQWGRLGVSECGGCVVGDSTRDKVSWCLVEILWARKDQESSKKKSDDFTKSPELVLDFFQESAHHPTSRLLLTTTSWTWGFSPKSRDAKIASLKCAGQGCFRCIKFL